jgi:hypothetical protein
MIDDKVLKQVYRDIWHLKTARATFADIGR